MDAFAKKFQRYWLRNRGNSFGEFTNAVRRLTLGVVLFAGIFAGLLWLLREVFSSVLAVLKATH